MDKMLFRILAVVLLSVLSVVKGKSVMAQLQHYGQQLRNVPKIIDEICQTIQQSQSSLSDIMNSTLPGQSATTQHSHEFKHNVGEHQRWACAKCKQQLDDDFQVFRFKKRYYIAVCSDCHGGVGAMAAIKNGRFLK